jgi:hypothetical protein
MKKYQFFLLTLLAFNFSFQQFIQDAFANWKILSTVRIENTTDKSGKYQVSIPIFSPELKKIDGKEIILKGYIIPLQELRKQNYFVLSRYPYSLCYFCGGAGIETVVEVNSKQEIKFTDNAIILRGILKLNPTNPNQLLYILNQAEIVKQ